MVSYNIDYTGCPDDLDREYINTAYFSADNITTISDTEAVQVGVDMSIDSVFLK